MTQPAGRVPPSDLLTVKEAADELRVHPETVRRLARGHKIDAVRVGGQWRISREENTTECSTLQQIATPRFET